MDKDDTRGLSDRVKEAMVALNERRHAELEEENLGTPGLVLNLDELVNGGLTCHGLRNGPAGQGQRKEVDSYVHPNSRTSGCLETG